MANNKLKTCKHCGAEIAKKAIVCPNCGGRNPKPLYKRVWFWLLIFFVIIPFLFGGQSSKNSDPDGPIEYMDVTVTEMHHELDENALNAEEKYNRAYVAVTGALSVIDSDGEYIAIVSPDELYTLDDVQCFIKTPEQLEVVRNLSKGDIITVKGRIREVGEVLGFMLDIDSIEND